MRFGIFFEHQLPRPWKAGDEHRLFMEALEQAELADQAGLDYVWETEHHFLEEYSHSSAPEVFLAAASQRTKRIRLGHGIIQLPPGINHPARVAERVATLDLLSGGRVDFGTGESSSAVELGAFGIPRHLKREMWSESLDVITRMFVEEPFAGHAGCHVTMPPRNVLPKPLQRPHPPLWLACSRRETIDLAAASGMGALSFAFIDPEQAAQWVRRYYDTICSDECIPRGFSVNANFAVCLPMMLHADHDTALQRGLDGAHFFGYSLGYFHTGTSHIVARADLWSEYCAWRQDLLNGDPGAIGTPSYVADLISRYAAAGVDQIIFILQTGRNKHEHICESIDLFGRDILPRFRDNRDSEEQAKCRRLDEAIEKALARRGTPRQLDSPYVVDEQAESSRSRSYPT